MMGEIISRIRDALIAVVTVGISAEMSHAQNVLVHNPATLAMLADVASVRVGATMIVASLFSY